MTSRSRSAKMAAKYLAFVKTPDPVLRQTGVSTDEDTGNKIDEMENAIIALKDNGEWIGMQG